MSTGHGRLQRALLAALDASEGLLSTFEVTAKAFHIAPDDDGCVRINTAQLSSARRALDKLAREGHIVSVGRGWHDRRAHWASKNAATAYEERKSRLSEAG